MHSIFDPNQPIPIYTLDSNGNSVCKDARNGKILQTTAIPTLPNGTRMEVFKRYKVKLLKKVYRYKPGTEMWVEMVPSAEIYLFSSEHSCEGIETVQENIDFHFC